MKATWPMRAWAIVYANYEPEEVHSLWRWKADAEKQLAILNRGGGMWELREMPLNWFPRRGEQPATLSARATCPTCAGSGIMSGGDNLTAQEMRSYPHGRTCDECWGKGVTARKDGLVELMPGILMAPYDACTRAADPYIAPNPDLADALRASLRSARKPRMDDAYAHADNCACDYDADERGFFECSTDPRCAELREARDA